MTQIHDLLRRHDGVLLRRCLSPRERAIVDRAVRDHNIIALLPGVYVRCDAGPHERLTAVMRRFPTAVAYGRTAAQLTFWPDLREPDLYIAGVCTTVQRPHLKFSRTRVNAAWIRQLGELRVTAPDLTALELAAATDGESLDRVLRSRQATIPGLRAALAGHPDRPGNRERRRRLLESRAEPWSAAERRLHTLLHRHRITGWVANHDVWVGPRRYTPDIAFPSARLFVEVDGYAFHSSPDAFEDDRERQNDLIGAGWTVLRFTWRMLVRSPQDVVNRIRRELVRSRRQSG